VDTLFVSELPPCSSTRRAPFAVSFATSSHTASRSTPSEPPTFTTVKPLTGSTTRCGGRRDGASRMQPREAQSRLLGMSQGEVERLQGVTGRALDQVVESRHHHEPAGVRVQLEAHVAVVGAVQD